MTTVDTVNDNVIGLAERAFVNMDFDYALIFVRGMAQVRPESATSMALNELVDRKLAEKSS